MRRSNFEEEANPKQYGFKSLTVELYKQDGRCYLSIGGWETKIDGGSFVRLVEGIGGMTPEESEAYIREQYTGGKVKNI